jgi:hypothetical protein
VPAIRPRRDGRFAGPKEDRILAALLAIHRNGFVDFRQPEHALRFVAFSVLSPELDTQKP